MVERFNRTLKAILRKHAARFGNQWDRYLPGILWTYRNIPHSSTGEKPSFLLFGIDCRSPTEVALLPTSTSAPTDVTDYREELMLSLSSARDLASKNIVKAQEKYKHYYDLKVRQRDFKMGEWVLIKFPQEESGRQRKLSRSWHGPYRIQECRGPDVTASKVYFPEEAVIQVHQTRVCPCPTQFPPGYYWYGGKRRGPGRPPKWVDKLLSEEGGDTMSVPIRADRLDHTTASLNEHTREDNDYQSPTSLVSDGLQPGGDEESIAEEQDHEVHSGQMTVKNPVVETPELAVSKHANETPGSDEKLENRSSGLRSDDVGHQTSGGPTGCRTRRDRSRFGPRKVVRSPTRYS